MTNQFDYPAASSLDESRVVSQLKASMEGLLQVNSALWADVFPADSYHTGMFFLLVEVTLLG